MESNPFLTAALRYAGRGWFVFPLYGMVSGRCECNTSCGSPGKHPRVKEGLYAASNDERVIQSWWKRWPHSNVGVVTGKQSGIYVVDLDNKRSVDLGNGILVGEGENSLRTKSLDIGSLPETLTSLTGSGGKHLLYSYPTTPNLTDASFGNRAGILPSVDTRGDGGYIVVPPSLHQSGNQYRWAEEDQPIVAMSEAWIAFLASNSTTKHPLDFDLPEGFTISEGEGRHDWLFRMGSKLRGQNGLGETALFGALQAYNSFVLRPPLEISEVRHIVESCLKFDPEIQREDLGPEKLHIPELAEGEDLAISMADLIGKDMPPFVSLVSGLLYQGEMLIIGGPPNVGKTWLTMDMMVAIASGEKFLGEFSTTQAPVLFIDEEGSERGNQARFKMLLEGRETLSASDYPIHAKIGSGIRLDAPGGRTAITRLIERYRPGVVFLDSLVRVHGGEENSSRAMADFFRMCKRIMDSYGCSFVFTHHIRKPSQNSQEDPAYMLRGSGDIQGFPDSVLVCLPADEPAEMQCIHTKMRHGERLPVFNVGMQILEAQGIARLGHRLYDPISAASKSRSKITDALKSSKRLMTVEEIAGTLGISLGTAKEHLKVLESINAIRSQREAGTTYYQSKF